MLTYKCYMDETGIQTHDHYCSIAGYSARSDVWEKFEYSWKWLLREYMPGVPEERRYFHALEFYGNYKPYSTWTPGKKRSFIKALFGAIREFDLALFSSTVDVKVFFSLTDDERRYLTGGIHNGMKWKTQGAPSKQYFLPFHHCVIQAAALIPDGALMFPIMSRQDQYKMKALECYEAMLNSYPVLQCRKKLAGEMAFSDMRNVGALQAADLATYWFGQLMKYRAKTGDRRYEGFPNMVEMRMLLPSVRDGNDLKLFNFEGIMLLLQGANRHIKTSFPTLDQALPSLPVAQRKEILGVMRKVNFRQFLDLWIPIRREDHG